MSLYIPIENCTVHLLVKTLGQTLKTMQRKRKKKIWFIFSGPPDIIFPEMKRHGLNKGWSKNNHTTIRNLNISTAVHSNRRIC